MSDSSSNLDQVSQSVSQREVQINELFDAASPATIFGRRASTCAGLVFGYYGGRIGGTSIANGTVTATASSANYVVADNSAWAVSIATTTTHWNDADNYVRLYKLTAGSSAITSFEDHRAGQGGFTGGGAGGAAGGGGLVLLASRTATTTTNLDFSGFISSSYDVYQFEFENLAPTVAGANFYAQMGTGGGPTWDAGSSSYMFAEYVSVTNAATAQASSGATNSITMMNSLSAASNKCSVGHMKLYKPSDTGFQKSVTFQTFHAQNGGAATQLVGGGTYLSTTAVTGVRFGMSAGDIASGTIRVYGIPNS